MAAGWTRWRRRDVVRGRFDATSLWSSFREAVTGPLPVTKPNHVELVPGPRILETRSKTLSKSQQSDRFIRQSFRQRPDYSLWDKLYVVTRSLERKQAIQQFNKRAVISGYLLPGPLEDYHGKIGRAHV